MSGRRRAVTGAGAMLLVALSACADAATTSVPKPEPPTAEARATATTPDDVDVDDLLVRRDGNSISVVRGPADRPDGAGRFVSCSKVAGGVDLCAGGDAHRSFVRWTRNHGGDWHRAIADLGGLMPWAADSLVPRAFVVVGGGDGATLYPFERVIRSTDGGATWTTYDVQRVDGERAYTTGQAVLADGRLLVVVEAWSDDRLNQRSRRHHGLWVSDPENLARYRPVMPTFDPPLPETPDGWTAIRTLHASSSPDPVLWVTTPADDRIYVSTDDARTFREISIP